MDLCTVHMVIRRVLALSVVEFSLMTGLESIRIHIIVKAEWQDRWDILFDWPVNFLRQVTSALNDEDNDNNKVFVSKWPLYGRSSTISSGLYINCLYYFSWIGRYYPKQLITSSELHNNLFGEKNCGSATIGLSTHWVIEIHYDFSLSRKTSRNSWLGLAFVPIRKVNG